MHQIYAFRKQIIGLVIIRSEKGEVYYLFKPSSKTFLGEIKTIVFKASQGRWHVTHVVGCSYKQKRQVICYLFTVLCLKLNRVFTSSEFQRCLSTFNLLFITRKTN